jgi:predicted nucleotidyltransferase
MPEARIEIVPEEARIVLDIVKRHLCGREVFVFGSRAKHRARRRSDLDLAVAGSQPLDLGTQANLACDFDESDLPYKVDVIDLATIAPEFRKLIEPDFVPLEVLQSESNR